MVNCDGAERLEAVVIALAAEMLQSGGLAADQDAAMGLARKALESGAAAERFQEMVSILGGPPSFLDRPEEYLPAAPIVRPVAPVQPGTVSAIDTRAVGVSVITLGGGRTRAEDPIDYSVGLTDLAPVGRDVGGDTPLAVIHARDEASFDQAADMIRKPYAVGGDAAATPIVMERID